ncbi:hypothetical protein [Thermosulfurimonas sp. F29]|uniref:hypothetical protein n=1 Tax=Thermosulfurimonas sp. F29 TaxID=2867247 RepID=UPI001C82B1F4|nr:hypothetical protein [Thermosulfurimonas sp. F29]MBX6423468.1 hypothetical protein [Thermosulfurimonas sp. F29]
MEKFSEKDFDLGILPEEAKKELIDFYQFLIFKYGKRVNKVEELKKLFTKPKGKLPQDYRFDREEVHAR